MINDDDVIYENISENIKKKIQNFDFVRNFCVSGNLLNYTDDSYHMNNI